MADVPVTDADLEYADRWAKGLSDAERDALANAHAAGRAEGYAAGVEATRQITVTQVWKKGCEEVETYVNARDIAGAVEKARAEEREACALACGAPDEDPSGDDPCSGNDGDTFDWAVRCASYWNAAAIRARSEGGKA